MAAWSHDIPSGRLLTPVRVKTVKWLATLLPANEYDTIDIDFNKRNNLALKIFNSLLTGTTLDKSKVKIAQNFVAFSEYINFNKLDQILVNKGFPILTPLICTIHWHVKMS